MMISYIVPVCNEEKNVSLAYNALLKVIKQGKMKYEIIFVNDGSTDRTHKEVEKLQKKDSNVRLIEFSRHFGKEPATTAGINNCKGDASMLFDSDLQFPVERIPDFIEKWKKGAEVVIGIREKNKDEGIVKAFGSFLFYLIMKMIAQDAIVPRATDFCLIDRVVIDAFNRLSEHNRMTRALIMWMGFRREFIYYTANKRVEGNAAYNITRLIRLATNSFISLSLFPLKIAGYLGIVITSFSGLFGVLLLVMKYIFHNAWFMSVSGSGQLAVIILFLIGIVLICIGLIALYIANIYDEVRGRPLYVVRGIS